MSLLLSSGTCALPAYELGNPVSIKDQKNCLAALIETTSNGSAVLTCLSRTKVLLVQTETHPEPLILLKGSRCSLNIGDEIIFCDKQEAAARTHVLENPQFAYLLAEANRQVTEVCTVCNPSACMHATSCKSWLVSLTDGCLLLLPNTHAWMFLAA